MRAARGAAREVTYFSKSSMLLMIDEFGRFGHASID
jgi:hypothetical protein